MAKYVIEIGLDANTAPRYDGTYSHLINLVQVDRWTAQTGDPWWFTYFSPDDEIVLRVCDYTSPAFGNMLIEVNSFVASFLESKDRRCLSPCLEKGVICIGKDYLPVQDTTSLVVDKAPCWRFVTGPRSKRECPHKLIGQHRALLRISIAATFAYEGGTKGTRELRWFNHDPEIFVGEGGPPTYSRPKSLKRR